MDKLREIQREYVKQSYAVSIEKHKRYMKMLEDEQEWEQLEYAKECLEELEGECEWLLSDETELDKYFEEWHKSEQMLKRKTTKYSR